MSGKLIRVGVSVVVPATFYVEMPEELFDRADWKKRAENWIHLHVDKDMLARYLSPAGLILEDLVVGGHETADGGPTSKETVAGLE